jgi:hypothetical protein
MARGDFTNGGKKEMGLSAFASCEPRPARRAPPGAAAVTFRLPASFLHPSQPGSRTKLSCAPEAHLFAHLPNALTPGLGSAKSDKTWGAGKGVKGERQGTESQHP